MTTKQATEQVVAERGTTGSTVKVLSTEQQSAIDLLVLGKSDHSTFR